MLQWRPEFVITDAMQGVSFKMVKKKHCPPKVVDNEPSSIAICRKKLWASTL